MNAFAFDIHLFEVNSRFSRLFGRIWAHYLRGVAHRQFSVVMIPYASVDQPTIPARAGIADMVATDVLDPSTGDDVRFRATPLQLNSHYTQTIARAGANQNCLVIAGTGSAKSLRFFVPKHDRSSGRGSATDGG